VYLVIVPHIGASRSFGLNTCKVLSLSEFGVPKTAG
jgi:hypothetical protein